MTGDLFVIINPAVIAQLVKQLTIDPKFKGSNPATIGIKREWQVFVNTMPEARLVEQSTDDPKFKGLNPAAADIR
jgi:hypothetical protein